MNRPELTALLKRPALATIMHLLNADGAQTRVIGGAVRNALLGLPSRDVDLATTLVPAQVMARAGAAKLRCIPTGLDHGTVTVLVAGEPFEVTTLREDVATDGRHATVRFGTDFAADALRRDFTINALSLDSAGAVFDYTDGLADIAAGRVRFIGDPRRRIEEDYLRSLRFFRFTASYGKDVADAAGLAAVIELRQGLRGLSRERVRMELFKLLAAPRAPAMAALLSETGLAQLLLGGLTYPARLQRASGRTSDPLLRLAAFALAIAEDAVRLKDRLRLSNEEARRLMQMAEVSASLDPGGGAPDAQGLAALALAHGVPAVADALVFGGARAGQAADWDAAAAALAVLPDPKLPFSGDDVMARGIASGRTIGRILKQLQADWIRAGFPREPAALARLLDAAVARARDMGSD